MGILKLPGLIDVHVHLREPGGEHKEDMTSGSAAALAGGVVMVLDMPNTYPPIVDATTLALKQRLAQEKALCEIGFFVGATETNSAPRAPVASEADPSRTNRSASGGARDAVGLKIYLDQTYGPLRMTSLAALLAHFRTWPVDRPIAVHAEGLSAAMAIGLARVFGRRLHLCHISRSDEIGLIRAAKESGAAVTCEVTPHHLLLTEADAERLGPYGSMKPPLAADADREALWGNLDVVDCIATDHAPHTRAEKEGPAPPPGVPGLETMLPLLLTAVADGRLTLERLVQLTHQAPLRIFGLPELPHTWVEVDRSARYCLSDEGLHTRCGWTPFAGMGVQGRIERVVLRGQTVFEAGKILARPGYGRVVVPVMRPS